MSDKISSLSSTILPAERCSESVLGMKDQYFSDARDLTKFDLSIFIAEQLPGIKLFTYVPMLTTNDGSDDGGLTDYRQGASRGDLYQFLQESVKKEQRKIIRLKKYFKSGRFAFQYRPYKDSQKFTHTDREAYFKSIPSSYLEASLVLVDPDNGIQPQFARRSLEKYITYSELEYICTRMDEASIIILYQHLPRVHRKAFLYSTATKLKDLLKCPLPYAVSDGSVAFILVAKNKKRQKELREALADYMRMSLQLYD